MEQIFVSNVQKLRLTTRCVAGSSDQEIGMQKQYLMLNMHSDWCMVSPLLTTGIGPP